MNNRLAELAATWEELREVADDLEAQLGDAKKRRDEAEQKLFMAMLEAEIDGFKSNGRSYSMKIDKMPSVVAEGKEAFYEALRARGFGDIIKETIHAQTLRATVNDEMRGNEGELPGWMAPYLRIYEKKSVGNRKA